MSTPEEHRAPVNPVELAVCSAAARTLEAAERYLAMSLDMTIVEGHGGPRSWEDGARDAVALRRQLDPVGLRLVRVEPEWP